MQQQSHFVLFVGATIFFVCHAQVNKTSIDGYKRHHEETFRNVSDNKNTTNSTFNYTNSLLLDVEELSTNTREPTASAKISTFSTTQTPSPSTTVISNCPDKMQTKITFSETPCKCSSEKYQTGILICIIIISILVLVCAVLIIVTVALANKASRLKTKLSQSKRQARSNGDFLSASSILWPLGLETLQKTAQAANLTMDEFSMSGNNTTQEEKHQLMQTAKEEDPKKYTEETQPKTKEGMPANFMVEI